MELNDHVDRFSKLGLNVAAVSYDSPEQNFRFSESKSLDYTLLSDVDATTVKTLGILNEKYASDHPVYGIPHPGIVVASEGGTVLSKYALPKYSERPDIDDVFDDISKVLKQKE